MKLPPGCERCAFGALDFVEAENGGADRCDCPRGQRLAAEDKKRAERAKGPRKKQAKLPKDWQRAAAGER